MASAEVLPHRVAYLPTDLDVRDVQFSSQQGKAKAPAGFPAHLEGKLVWRGGDLEKAPGEWVSELSADDITAIEAALEHFQALGVSPSLLDRDNFPLPQGLAERLELVSEACYAGVGFAVLRGLDPARYTEEQNSLIFAGLAKYVAASRGFQDYKREHVLCHIVHSHGNTPAFSDGAMAFHTDTGEILALSSLKVAAQGGTTLLASVWQMYNDLLELCPEALQTLSEDWVFDTHQDYSQFPPFTRPVLHAKGGKVLLQLSRYRLTGYGPRPRNPALPALTPRQVRALNAFQIAAANSCMRLRSVPGDMLFINNLGVVHGREAFAGDAAAAAASDGGRHVLKLFLRDPRRSWDIPAALEPAWEELYGPNRPDGSRDEKWILDNSAGASQKNEWSSNG